MNSLFLDYLTNELGMADTRAMSLTNVIDDLHSNIGRMDNRNRNIMRKNFPDLMNLVATFADYSPMLDDYRA
jgi:RNA processing factor Prp31